MAIHDQIFFLHFFSLKFLYIKYFLYFCSRIMKVASQKTEERAKRIWDKNNLEDSLLWQEEMWNDNEFDPVWGSTDFEGWSFTTNENSDYIHFWSPDGEEGDFLRDIIKH